MPATICLSPETRPARADRLWRRKDAEDFTDADREAIRRFVSEAVVDDPRWIGASTGNIADAAALVVAAWPAQRFDAELDVLMTGLLNCALSNGNNTKAAAVVLYHTLAQLGAHGKRSCKSAAASWHNKLRSYDYEEAIRRPQPVRHLLNVLDQSQAAEAA
ncbi:hypothetical protein [Bradyrhizobium japonicum]|uniref:hypothetical protein n=1 Tax=Bradyrhizobium japonicum TaxID=375 RepID=UPI001BAB3267|nr:hypothetical protein [Bradyrhizobium japonicum]MBR0764412.1 hypothetical protein [Bradyrhizobium japonicum]